MDLATQLFNYLASLFSHGFWLLQSMDGHCLSNEQLFSTLCHPYCSVFDALIYLRIPFVCSGLDRMTHFVMNFLILYVSVLHSY